MNEPTRITNESISSALAFANKVTDQLEARESFYHTARKLVASGINSGLIAKPRKKTKQYTHEGRKEIVENIIEMKATGLSYIKAAAICGIDSEIFYKWRKDLAWTRCIIPYTRKYEIN